LIMAILVIAVDMGFVLSAMTTQHLHVLASTRIHF
jgi:hypothetical protein